ncbi:MAG: photosynthetic reaction center cytochrome c subunit family protein [Acidobacteriota bacterium]|nr:photosynthetic reaction center cytochrome c subunit family protein [Acidobacteriota bacterium]
MRIKIGWLGIASACVLSAQTPPKPVMVEDVLKDVRMLKGISVNEFMATMGFFSASTGKSCNYCHVEEAGGDWARYADDHPNKTRTRGMIAMAAAINKNYFGGRRMLTCYSCHRGGERPQVTPSLTELYSTPPALEPDRLLASGPNAPSVDLVLDKYIQALGGERRLAALTSFVAKGVVQGYASAQKLPLELYAKAPNQRAQVVHTDEGPSATIFDGTVGWIAAPATDRPVTLTALAAGDLDGARLDAVLNFPAGMKQSLRQWRAGTPATIDDRDVQVIQATSDGRYPVNLYFDSETGLLVRSVRYADSPVGLSPTQVDYADYREVAGVKMPFRWTVTWLDGRSIVTLKDVQANAAVDAAKFRQPH